MRFRCFASATLITALSVPHVVAAAETVRSVGSERLNPILVTATRIPQHRDETLAATTVITREDIKRRQPQSVQELLRWTPGISVSNSGGPGRLTSVFMRGTQSNHTVVLINGVRYDDITSGIAAIQDIPVSQIERIEIVRGPFSSLYGSDAMGGVIQIFTRDGADAHSPVQPYVSVGGGSYGTHEETAGLSGRSEDAHYNLTLGHKEADGFNSCRGSTSAGCFAVQPDDDGYERTSGSLRAGFSLGERTEIELHALRVESEVEFDGGPFVGNTSDNLRQVLGTSILRQLTGIWQTEVAIGHERNETENFYRGTAVNRIDSSITSLRWQNNLEFSADNHLTVGADYRDEQVDSTSQFTQTERDSAGIFTQYMGRFGPHQVQLGLRADDYEAFDDPVTGSIRYGWHPDPVHTITASYGTAFSAPTFVDLYFPFGSNPNLKPEESESFELGFKAARDWGHWAVYAYQTKIDDLIVFDLGTFTPRNISKARIRGVEASIDAAFGPWDVNAGASWLDPENRSGGANRGNQLVHRPQYSATVGVDRRFGAFSVGGSVNYGGSRYEDAANKIKLDDFILVGLRGSWNVTDALQLEARVDNLFDTDYETVQYYNQPGRAYFVSLSYRP